MPSSTPPPPCALPTTGLPLTGFEEYMLLDDRPSHPMVIVARFDFQGSDPPATLADAFTTALLQEPLLTARIERTRGGRPRWVPAAMPTLAFAALADHVSMETLVPPLPRLDPDRGPMLNACVLCGTQHWSIVIAAHHAACDGLALVGFVDRWLTLAADRQPAGPRDPGGPISALRGRGRVARSWGEFARMLPRLAKGLEGVWQFIGHEVLDLGFGAPDDARFPDSTDALWQPTILSITLDEASVAALQRRARDARVTVNDLLLTALVETIGRHVEAEGGPREHRAWIRVATPISLRTKADRSLPAANRVSMVFLDRPAIAGRDEPRLRRGFREEMDVIRGHHLGHVFPLSLEAGRWLPGGLRRATRRPSPQATAVLSNLGRCFHRPAAPEDAGALWMDRNRLVDWWIVPPVRPGTALAMATHETRGRRTITCHVDATRVTPQQARCWLEDFRGALGCSGASPVRSPLEHTTRQ